MTVVPTPTEEAMRRIAAKSYESEWKSIMRGARPPFWRIAGLWLSVPLALEAGLGTVAWYGLRLRSPVFIAVFGVAVVGILAAFVIFLHRSGYKPVRRLTNLGLEPGPRWRRPTPCVYELDREREDPAVWPKKGEEEDPRIAELFGPGPTAEEMTAVRASAAERLKAAEEHVLKGCVTVRATGRIVAVSRHRMLRRIRRGRLVALHRDATYYVPAWQLRGGGFLRGVEHVIAGWPGSPLALTDWAEQPSVDLADRTPAQALDDGDLRAVLELEAAIVAAAW
jgi:hypothetical protein